MKNRESRSRHFPRMSRLSGRLQKKIIRCTRAPYCRVQSRSFCLPPSLAFRTESTLPALPRNISRYISVKSPERSSVLVPSGSRCVPACKIIAGNSLAALLSPDFLNTDSLRAVKNVQNEPLYRGYPRGVARQILFILENARRLSKLVELPRTKRGFVLLRVVRDVPYIERPRFPPRRGGLTSRSGGQSEPRASASC